MTAFSSLVILVFAAPSFISFSQYSVGRSDGFLALAVILAAYPALPVKDKALWTKRFRISFIAALLLSSIRLWSLTLFSSVWMSLLAVCGVVTLVFTIHALLPKVFVRFYSEQINPSTPFSRKLVAISGSLLPTLIPLGASIGRSVARQYPEQALGIMAILSFSTAMIFLHLSISDSLYRADISNLLQNQKVSESSHRKKPAQANRKNKLLKPRK